jgi:hypothetical protein
MTRVVTEFTYCVFDLILKSNLQIPELDPIPQSAFPPDISVHLKISPFESGDVPSDPEELSYSSAYKGPDGNPALRIWKVAGGDYLRLQYFDGTQFWLNRACTEVWAVWPEELTIADTATYLLGPVLGILLRLRGVTCLHASAVAFGDRVAAFVGSEGAGKSTTAAALAQRGHPILSDDVVALAERDGSFFVHPACPYLCLWPESVESLYGSSEALPPFSRNDEKRCLSLRKKDLRFAERSLPLATIYILGERRDNPAPVVEAIPLQKALVALVVNSFATNLLDRRQRVQEFELLGRLVPIVPVRQLSPLQDAKRLDELCDLICHDMQGLVAPKVQ